MRFRYSLTKLDFNNCSIVVFLRRFMCACLTDLAFTEKRVLNPVVV